MNKLKWISDENPTEIGLYPCSSEGQIGMCSWDGSRWEAMEENFSDEEIDKWFPLPSPFNLEADVLNNWNNPDEKQPEENGIYLVQLTNSKIITAHFSMYWVLDSDQKVYRWNHLPSNEKKLPFLLYDPENLKIQTIKIADSDYRNFISEGSFENFADYIYINELLENESFYIVSLDYSVAPGYLKDKEFKELAKKQGLALNYEKFIKMFNEGKLAYSNAEIRILL